MRLTWRRSVRAEDRFETWLAQRYQKQVLESGVTAPVLAQTKHSFGILPAKRVEPRCRTRGLITQRVVPSA